MPTDTQIPGPQTQAAPSNYLVPPSVEFLLKTVSASFTDNGAAGDWLPAVVLLSDSGHIIARAVDQAVKVTAGDSASVSWFPGVKHAAAAATAAGAQWAFAGAITTDPHLTVPAGSGAYVTWYEFETSDPASYALATISAGHDGVKLGTPGMYLALASVTWITTAHDCSIVLQNAAYELAGFEGTAPATTANLTGLGGNLTQSDTQTLVINGYTEKIGLAAYNSDGFDHVIESAGLSIFYWPNSTPF